jgi:hypothetical protein
MSVSFKLVPVRPGSACTSMVARIPTDQYDTWGYLNKGARAQVQLWGDPCGTTCCARPAGPT